jgi:hypothetical protein
MTVVVRHSPKSLTKERYDEVSQRMEESGSWPPDGLDMHVCFGSEGSLRVSEIWDTEEQLRAFSEKLMPALEDAGVEVAAEPEVLEVHELQKR